MAESRRVVLAVDDSEASERAVTWALTSFLRPSDRVLLLTSQTYVPASDLPSVDLAAGGEYAVPIATAGEDAEEIRRSDGSKALVSKYMQLCEHAKIACEGEVVSGDPGTHICEEAKRIAADVIIVGSHGYGIIKRTLLGSISDYVLHHSHGPVIIVRYPSGSEQPVNAGQRRTIVIAVDDSDESSFAFTWALSHVCSESDRVVLLHVQARPSNSPTSIGIDQFGLEEVYVPPDSSMSDDVAQLDYSESLVQKYMAYASAESKIQCEGRVVTGSAEEKVCQELIGLSADAVVLGTHKVSAVAKTFLGSVSDYLAHYSPCPVIVAKKPTPVEGTAAVDAQHKAE